MRVQDVDYVNALKELSLLVSKYTEVRDHGTIDEVQNLRDDMGEQLFWFGPKYATLRADMGRAEARYKRCLAEKTKYWKEELKARGNAELIKTNAILDCDDLQEEYLDRCEDFYLAKSLIERTDQILNSIATRFKLMNKHE